MPTNPPSVTEIQAPLFNMLDLPRLSASGGAGYVPQSRFGLSLGASAQGQVPYYSRPSVQIGGGQSNPASVSAYGLSNPPNSLAGANYEQDGYTDAQGVFHPNQRYAMMNLPGNVSAGAQGQFSSPFGGVSGSAQGTTDQQGVYYPPATYSRIGQQLSPGSSFSPETSYATSLAMALSNAPGQSNRWQPDFQGASPDAVASPVTGARLSAAQRLINLLPSQREALVARLFHGSAG